MALPDHIARLREKVGHDLLFLPSVACLIRDTERRILLVRHVEGWWTLPGGFVDVGETPAEAARREVREEVSVEVELLGIAGVFGGPEFHGVYGNGDEVAWVSTVFEARITDGEARAADDETAEIAWVTIDDAFELAATPPWQHVLACVRDGRAF